MRLSQDRDRSRVAGWLVCGARGWTWLGAQTSGDIQIVCFSHSAKKRAPRIADGRKQMCRRLGTMNMSWR